MSIGSSADEATHFSEDEYHDSLGDIDPMIDTESDLELDTPQVPQVTPLITDNAFRPLPHPWTLNTQLPVIQLVEPSINVGYGRHSRPSSRFGGC